MSVYSRVTDSLRNLVSGLGGPRDQAASGSSYYEPHTGLDSQQVEAAYRINWMIRKAVDIPAFDMMREGWLWTTDKEKIGKIERNEKRLMVAQKVLNAMTMGRLFGGAAIFIHDGSRNLERPLSMAKGKLKFLTMLTRSEIVTDEIELDPLSEFYGEPKFYNLLSATGQQLKVHPSRVARFLGNPIPRQSMPVGDQWSDSIVDVIDQVIRDATGTQQGIAHLVQEAKVDVISIKGLMKNVGDAKYRQKIIERNQLGMQTKSITNALMLDMDDKWEQKTQSFAQLPEVIQIQLMMVSGAVDIPATRFLAQSPSGMNSTGESDLKNYYDRTRSEQNLRLRPPLTRILDAVAIDALGSIPKDCIFEFRPLWQMSAKEQSEIAKSFADSTKVIMDTGLQPREVMAKAQANQMIESGAWPGFEAALELFDEEGKMEDFTEKALTEPEPGEELNNQLALIAAKSGIDPAEEDPTKKPTHPAAMADSTPRTLYIRRDVTNGKDIVKWAKAQGFETVVDPLSMHVTVCYSKTPIDWMKLDPAWSEKLTVNAGGPRVVEEFDGGAIVLEFRSPELRYRNAEILEAGATSERSEYHSHITITFSKGLVDIDKVEPYTGKIELGPEIWEQAKEKALVVEDGQ